MFEQSARGFHSGGLIGRNGLRAGGILPLLLLGVSAPASADTSPPFFGYLVAIAPPFTPPGGGGAMPMLKNIPGTLPGRPSTLPPSTPRLLRRRPGAVPPSSRTRRGASGTHAHPLDSSYSGDGFYATCYSGDGTIPDGLNLTTFFGNLISGGNLTSCSQASSFNDAVNLSSGSGPTATANGTISGSMAQLSVNLNVGPPTLTVIIDFQYLQTFDSPLPPGSQLTFSWTADGFGIAAFSDCTENCTASSSNNGDQYTETITIGPSGQYSIFVEYYATANLEAVTVGSLPGPTSYTGSVNLGCAMQAIPTPASGMIPAFGLPGNNWSLNYSIGSNDGLEVTGVKLGNRSMASKMSVPWVNINTTDFNQQNCQLQADGSGSCASKLVYFQSGTNDVTAIYVFTNIPQGTQSCLVVTQNYEFDQPQPGDMCEPSGNVGCARFYPTVAYDYLPDDDSKSVNEIDIPMRIQFTVGKSETIGTDDDVTGIENFFDGNPVKKELYLPGVIQNGAPGAADDFYQTYLSQIDSPPAGVTGPIPDCPTCVQIHWRWPLVFQSVPGFGDDNGGEPLIPQGSTQTVDIAMVAYPDQQQNACSNLASGQQLSGVPSVFWYCGKGYDDSDTFFQHGGFFNPLSGTLSTPNISLTKGGFRINHSNGQWGQTVTLTNNGSDAVTGPLALVIGSLTPGVTLANADGTTANVTPTGTPYVFAPLDANSQLGPGQSLTVTLQFTNPKNVAITYSTQVYAGGLL